MKWATPAFEVSGLEIHDPEIGGAGRGAFGLLHDGVGRGAVGPADEVEVGAGAFAEEFAGDEARLAIQELLLEGFGGLDEVGFGAARLQGDPGHFD